MIYIGFWKRMAAFLIDFIIVIIFSIFMFFNFILKLYIGAYFGVFIILITVILYFALFEASKLQATPGKLIAGIKVADATGKRISFAKSFLRSFLKIIIPLFLPFFGEVALVMCVFTKNKQNIYDFAAGSFVIYKQLLDESTYDQTDIERLKLFKKKKSSLQPVLIVVTIIALAAIPMSPYIYWSTKQLFEKRAAKVPAQHWQKQNLKDINVKINAPVKLVREKNSTHYHTSYSTENTAKQIIKIAYLKDINAAQTQKYIDSVFEWVEDSAKRYKAEIEKTTEDIQISGISGTKATFTNIAAINIYDFNCKVIILYKNSREAYIFTTLSKEPVFSKNINDKIINSIEITQ